MESSVLTETPITVSVSNIGGIDEASVTLPPGVSVLTGRNATNRSSFLQALTAGLGSDHCSLKGDADSGSVTIEVAGERYTRTLTREGDDIVFGGDPYLADAALADLFAFLLERNEARQTIARGDDLRSIMMRPVDTEAITDEIAACKRDRKAIDAELERLDEREAELTDLTRTRDQTREEYDSTATALEAAREQLAQHETDVTQSRSNKQALEAAFDRVRDARKTLETIEFDIETERSTREALTAERDRLESELDATDVPEADTARLRGRLEACRERKRELTDKLSGLADVIRFNEELRDEDGLVVSLEDDTSREPAALTNALQENAAVTCWTCGSSVAPTEIDAMIETLRTLRGDLLDTRSDVQREVDDLTDEQQRVKTARTAYERTERELEKTRRELEATDERLAELRADRETQQAIVEEREAAAADIDVGDHEEVLDHHREVTELELALEQLEADLDDIDATITAHETALETRDRLVADREECTEALTALRTRIERLEADAIDAFNTHMETVLGLLEYDNLDRIWIERREVSVRDGRQTVTRGQFELHVVRSDASGTAYEDTIEHLSESEREVTGLVFALAGYLVHEVYDEVPVIVLDSLEAIDADRIARVIDYLDDHATYLVAALLPADAAALADSHTYISDIA